MPLDRIDRRPEPPLANPFLSRARIRLDWKRRLVALNGLVALVLLVAGCNAGTMGEARESQAYDAAVETPQLSAQQATRTASAYFDPTATPSPAPPLPPILDQVVITLGVGPDGAPSGSYLSVPADAGSAFAAAQLRGVRAGQVVSATWTDAFGNVVSASEAELTTDSDAQWVNFPLPLNGGLSAGEYALYIFSGGRQLGSLAFSITGPGTGAQLLPDPPANPQARPRSEPRREERREENDGQTQNEWEQQPAEGEWQQSSGEWQQSGGEWQQQPDGSWQQQDDWSQ